MTTPTSTGRRGYVTVARHWLTDERLSSTDIHLMLWLDSHSDEYLAGLHIKRAAAELGWSRNRVIRSIDTLESVGLIGTELVQHGDGKRTRFTIHQSEWTEQDRVTKRDTPPADCAPKRNTPVLRNEAHPVLRNGTPTTSTSIELVTNSKETEPSQALALAEAMADGISHFDGTEKRPTVTKAWIADMDRLMRIDGRSYDEVVAVLRWLYTDQGETATFWAPNVRSPKKLRAKWATMAGQYRRRPKLTKSQRGDEAIEQARLDLESDEPDEFTDLIRSMFGPATTETNDTKELTT